VVLRGIAAVLAATLSLTLPSELFAGGQWPDGPNKEYLKNLQRPDNWKNPGRALGNGRSLSCCDVGDTIKTMFKVESAGNGELGDYPEDRWYAWINGQWVLVPPDKIVPHYAPDGTRKRPPSFADACPMLATHRKTCALWEFSQFD
jgi:hypothetical protein